MFDLQILVWKIWIHVHHLLAAFWWRWDGQGVDLTSCQKTETFFFLGSRLLVQSGANSTGSSPKQGSLVPGVPGEVGGGGDMVVKGRTWQDECIQSGVTRPTAAWTSSRANPAEPGRSLRPSPGRAPPGCDEEDTACPGVRKGTPCGDRGVVQHKLNKICSIINLWK